MPSPATELLIRVFGYDSFRGDQESIIEHTVSGGDSLVLMPTGGGKSLCYQIPAMLRHGVGIVVSPLIALMRDQVDGLAQLGVRAAFLNSTQSPVEAGAVESDLRRGRLDLLYVAPERLLGERTLSVDWRYRCRAVRHRRSALCLAVGSRLSPRVPRALDFARALSRGAENRADRDRRRADSPGDHRAARAREG